MTRSTAQSTAVNAEIETLEDTNITTRGQFERMRLATRLERDRLLIAQYEEHQAFYRDRVEEARYKLGRLDKRLGGES